MLKEIKVTRTCIKHGVMKSPEWCMIAQAIRKELGCDVSVDYDEVTLWNEDEQATYCLPHRITENIHKWDNGEKIEPFRFTLNVRKEFVR